MKKKIKDFTMSVKLECYELCWRAMEYMFKKNWISIENRKAWHIFSCVTSKWIMYLDYFMPGTAKKFLFDCFGIDADNM